MAKKKLKIKVKPKAKPIELKKPKQAEAVKKAKSLRKQKKEAEKEASARERLFVAEYIIDFNATRAARAAGYSKNVAEHQASRLLGNVGVHHAITEALEKKITSLSMERKDVVKGLITVYQRTMQEVEVTDMWGNPTGFWKFDSKGALKALELIGKHLGMFPTNVKMSNDPKNPVGQIATVTLFIPDNGRINPETKN